MGDLTALYDCLIITAIAEEWHAVCQRLKNQRQPSDVLLPAKAGNVGRHRVLCILIGKGQENAASALQRTLDKFPTARVLLTGIAGGLSEKNVRHGDVIFAQFVYGFDFGKLTSGQFIRRPDLDFSCDRSLLAYAEVVATNPADRWTSRITHLRPGANALEKPQAIPGYIGSSGKVVDDQEQCVFEAARQHILELHAVEMEGTGVGAVIRLVQSERHVCFLMIRGISDVLGDKSMLGGSEQRSAWKSYAADAASAFAEALLESLPLQPPRHWENAATELSPRPPMNWSNTIWKGDIHQGTERLAATIYIQEWHADRIKGEIHFQHRGGVGKLTFEGNLVDDNRVIWITNKKEGSVTFPGLYIGSIEGNNISGIWQVPGAKQYDRFNVELAEWRSASAADEAILSEDGGVVPNSHALMSNYDVAFAELVNHFKDPKITAYPGFGWGTALSLQDAPGYGGWPMSKTELDYNTKEPFQLSKEKRRAYQSYVRQFRQEKGFNEDNIKFMLERNPTSFSDAPSLLLTIKKCRWSEMCFYRDNVANSSERDILLDELIMGSLYARFPHAFCMHMVVITADNKLLGTQRSPKVAFYPGAWSCSAEETLAASDLSAKRDSRMLAWGMRLLREELGLDRPAAVCQEMRLLSVFLESECLNISVCTEAILNINASKVSTILQGHRRKDWEFTQWDYLEMDRSVLLQEITHPRRRYHPTSGYRLVQTLLKHFGVPSRAEIAKVNTG